MEDVRIVSRRMIRPETTSSRRPPELEPETVIHLTPWDLQMMTVEHIQKGILLPKPPQGHSHGVDTVERLASSFARALGRFYTFAGRLAVEELEQQGGIAISLRCTGEGAEFVHAVAPGVTVADITSLVYVPPVVWSFFPLDGLLDLDAAVASLPVLAVQVTELDDGVFLAMSLNHAVADGTTFWHFFNTWSEISRRSDTDGAIGSEITSPLPVLRRWFPDGCPIPIPLPSVKLADIVSQRTKCPQVQECYLHFSAESVKKLKAKANAEMAGAPATISSLQALLAHMWRAVCRARHLALDQEVPYIILVGCRGRLESMPSAYVGNAVSLVTVRSTAGEILQKGLGWTGWLLNRAVASFDMASARAEAASWPQNPSFVRLLVSVDAAPPKLVTGSSPRFNIYGNNFGWGSPVTVRSGSANKVDGKMTVYEGGHGAGSMALEVCLAPEALARLVADEEFMAAVSSTKA